MGRLLLCSLTKQQGDINMNTVIITTITATISSIVGISISSYFIVKHFSKKIKLLEEENKKYDFKIRSAYCRFGKTFEKFVPFTKDFPSDKERAVFLGMPIDFVSFDDDKIRFIEVKTGNSQLSPKQEKIKKMIENKLVEFKELRY